MIYLFGRIEREVKSIKFPSQRLKGYSYTHDRVVLKLSSAPSFLWNEKGALMEVDEYGRTKM